MKLWGRSEAPPVSVPARPDLAPRRVHTAKALSPDGLKVVEFPPAFVASLRLYGLRGSYGAIYRSQPNVSGVVDRIAKDVGAIKIKTYAKIASTPLLPSSRIELDDSDLQRLFDRPGGRVSPSRFRRALASDILIFDEAYIRKIGVGGRIGGLMRVPVPSVIPERDPVTAAITGYRIAGRPQELLSLDEVIRFPGYDPESTTGSVASMEKLRRILAEDQAAGQWRENFYRNSARREGMVERPLEAGQFNDEVREAWRTDLESTLSGADGSGRVGLLEDGMKWVESSWSPKDAEYLGARQLSRKEVAAFFGMPLSLAGATNAQPTKDERTSYLTDIVVPLLTRIEDEFDVQIVPDFDPIGAQRMYVQFNIDAKLRGSFEEQAAIIGTAAGGPIITVNEARARLNLPPIAGGDRLYAPLNSVAGGGPQASPQNPVETPATTAGNLEPAGITPGGGTRAVDKSALIAALVEAKAITDAELRTFAGLPAGRLLRAKAVPRAPLARRKAAAEQYAEVFRRTFKRQARAVASLMGKASGAKSPPWHVEERDDRFCVVKDETGETVGCYDTRKAALAKLAALYASEKKTPAGDIVWLDGERWNRELTADLVKLSITVVDDSAKRAARQLRGTYDPERTRAYISTRAQIAAENINRQTKEAVADALADDTGDGLRAVFEQSTGARADGLGLSMATSAIAFGRMEAAHQTEQQSGKKLSKVWTVTSANSRHPELDGQSVGIDDMFSNGLLYPGDPTGDVSETAGCECLMNVVSA